MSFNWKKIDHVLAEIFTFGTEASVAAQPIINVTNPGVSALYNLSVNAAVEAASKGAEAASTHQSSGPDQVAAVAAAVAPVLAQATSQAGVAPHTQEQINAYANTVVTGLTILGATTAPPA